MTKGIRRLYILLNHLDFRRENRLSREWQNDRRMDIQFVEISRNDRITCWTDDSVKVKAS